MISILVAIKTVPEAYAAALFTRVRLPAEKDLQPLPIPSSNEPDTAMAGHHNRVSAGSSSSKATA
jgi:hypothetical protein